MDKKKKEDYKISEKAKSAWKSTIGSLTDMIPKGKDGESLNEYLERKRWEEK